MGPSGELNGPSAVRQVTGEFRVHPLSYRGETGSTRDELQRAVVEKPNVPVCRRGYNYFGALGKHSSCSNVDEAIRSVTYPKALIMPELPPKRFGKDCLQK